MICQGLINWFNLLRIKARQFRKLNLLSSLFLNYYYADCYYYYTTTTVVISQEFCYQDILFFFIDSFIRGDMCFREIGLIYVL